MRYFALATDYDGTIATHGTVTEPTVEALLKLKGSGRKLILVTGRELSDLFNVFPHCSIFDRIVAENGALLYRPDTKEEHPLSTPPPRDFADLLRTRGVAPLSIGRVIVATNTPNETLVLQAIRDLGLELQVAFNKGAVMILPSGVNKATGLSAALQDLSLSPRNIVGVGDAENDHAFLDLCECSAAVANALPALKERADLVMAETHGDGVTELINRLIANDLTDSESKISRHQLSLGLDDREQEILVPPYGANLLIAGRSERREHLLAAILARLFLRCYQVCVIDPIGDFPAAQNAVVFERKGRAPVRDAILSALDRTQNNVVVKLAGTQGPERQGFVEKLLCDIKQLRERVGRPHWIVIRNADDLLTSSSLKSLCLSPEGTSGYLLMVTEPRQLEPEVLAIMNFVVALDESPGKVLDAFCDRVKRKPPTLPNSSQTEALFWKCSNAEAISFKLHNVEKGQPSACAPANSTLQS